MFNRIRHTTASSSSSNDSSRSPQKLLCHLSLRFKSFSSSERSSSSLSDVVHCHSEKSSCDVGSSSSSLKTISRWKKATCHCAAWDSSRSPIRKSGPGKICSRKLTSWRCCCSAPSQERSTPTKSWSKTPSYLYKGRRPFGRADVCWIWRQASKCVP